jgi:hypothetical protein
LPVPDVFERLRTVDPVEALAGTATAVAASRPVPLAASICRLDSAVHAGSKLSGMGRLFRLLVNSW